jgi:hypothetical protein
VSLYMGNGMMAGILIRGSPARIRSRNPVDINRQGMRGTQRASLMTTAWSA